MKSLECSRLNAKNRVRAGEENLVDKSVKNGRKIPPKRRTEMLSLSRAERISFTIRKKKKKRSQCCILLDRLTERDC